MGKDDKLTAKTDPYELDAIDRQILKNIVDYPLIKNTEIGAKLGLHPETIGKRRKKPAFVRAHEDLMSTTDALLERAQKMAARRLIKFVTDPDKKFALDAMKVALSQRAQKKEVQVKEEVIFQTRVGNQGQLMQEVIEVEPRKLHEPEDDNDNIKEEE
jgi:Ribonuclease G/E